MVFAAELIIPKAVRYAATFAQIVALPSGLRTNPMLPRWAELKQVLEQSTVELANARMAVYYDSAELGQVQSG